MLVVTSVNPNQGSLSGGYNVTLTGLGFHNYNLDLINVTICGQRALVL